MPSCSVMDRMKSSCDRIIRRESGPTSGGSRRWKWPLIALAAGDVRRWGNPPNEAADTRWCVGYSERQDHRGIGYTLKAIVKSGRLGYAVTRCQSSEAQARCGETRPPGFWKGGVPRGTPPIRLHNNLDNLGHSALTRLVVLGLRVGASCSCLEIRGFSAV